MKKTSPNQGKRHFHQNEKNTGQLARNFISVVKLQFVSD